MPVIQIKLDEDAILAAIDKKLDEIASNIFATSQEQIVQKGIIDEGTLLKSGNINREFLQKTIIYSAPYSDSIEFGRLPGSMPPVEMIKAWVLRKGISTDEKEAQRIAWAIATDIKEYGLDPRPFMSPAVEIEIVKIHSK
jgi:hypothetical protein